MNRNTRRGFTVVELMVVVGIFIVLIGLVIPTASKVRQSALRTQCLTQMRGLQFAYLAYAQDHNGRLLDFDDMLHSGLTDEEAKEGDQPLWYFVLQEYYDTKLVLRSPLDDSPHWAKSMGGQGVPVPPSANRFRRTSYGLNDHLMALNPEQAWSPDPDDPDVTFDRLSKIRSPANTMGYGIVAFEGTNAGSDHFHAETWLFQSVPPTEQHVASFMQTNAHGGKKQTWDAQSGYSFLDGHVGTYRFSDIVMPGNPIEQNKLNPRAAAAYAAQRWMNN